MELHERIALWQTHPRFDEDTRMEVSLIAKDEREALGRFGRELSFGTGGLRGVLGAGTNRMNRYTVARATQGLANYLKGLGAKSVAIAYDSRKGSREFAGIAAGVLGQNGLRAYVYDQLMPTPLLSFAVRELRCDAGIVITASHNPSQYNGYKVYGRDGCQITDETARAITAHIDRVAYEDLNWLNEDKAREAGLWMDIPPKVAGAYIEKTLACRVSASAHPLKIVYTPLHGTGLIPVRSVFASMPGIECVEVAAQCIPDGDFPTCPMPNPELPQALVLGLDTAKREGAALLMATDPDCDRVGVAVRDRMGEYRILSGNEVGLLLLHYILETRKAAGTLPFDAVVIKTIVTSDLAFSLAKAYGAQVLEVLTGFKYIGEAIGRMEEMGEGSRFIFGFEESCGYLCGTHVRDKDGVLACMLIAEMAQDCAARGLTLWDAVQELYQTFGTLQSKLLNFDIEGPEPMRAMQSAMQSMRETPPRLMGEGPVTMIRDYLPGLDGLPPSDVLSFENAAGCKAIVRPSGTEPKVKIYLSAHGMDAGEAQKLMEIMERQAAGWMT